jgi:hypothetical protein
VEVQRNPYARPSPLHTPLSVPERRIHEAKMTLFFNLNQAMRVTVEAAIVILALVVSMVAELPANVANAQSPVSTTSTNEPYAQCLQEVPYDVRIGSYGNFQAAGYSATFPNGTKVLYPDTSCLRPVYPNLYGVVLAIGDNPSFIALENGSLYSFSTIGSPNPFLLQNLTTETTSCRNGSTKVPGGQVECFAGESLDFFLYNGTILNGCGSPYAAFTGWIQVQVPVNSTTGELDTTNIVAQQNGPFGGGLLCTSVTTITRTSSSTVTFSQALLVALVFASCIIGLAITAWRRRSGGERLAEAQ